MQAYKVKPAVMIVVMAVFALIALYQTPAKQIVADAYLNAETRVRAGKDSNDTDNEPTLESELLQDNQVTQENQNEQAMQSFGNINDLTYEELFTSAYKDKTLECQDILKLPEITINLRVYLSNQKYKVDMEVTPDTEEGLYHILFSEGAYYAWRDYSTEGLKFEVTEDEDPFTLMPFFNKAGVARCEEWNASPDVIETTLSVPQEVLFSS